LLSIFSFFLLLFDNSVHSLAAEIIKEGVKDRKEVAPAISENLFLELREQL
jgi:hypothetical protein